MNCSHSVDIKSFDEWWMMNDECPKKKEFCIGKCCAVIRKSLKMKSQHIKNKKWPSMVQMLIYYTKIPGYKKHPVLIKHLAGL